jgi:hypothetical protein
MTTKAEFDAEQWSKIAAGPFVAGLTVIAADRGGTVRETVAMAKVIAEEQQAGENPELVKEVMQERPNPQSLLGADGEKPTTEDLPVKVEQILREALEMLEAKATPEEVEAYKRLCLEIAQRVAERTKSGGVLGIGGERVSGDEQAAIDRLRSTLGI